MRSSISNIHLDGLSTKNISIPTRDGHSLSCRLYSPDNRATSTELTPLYIYLHGGGFLFGSIETEDMHCRLLCVNVPCVVMNIDYRHTPEWKFPTQFNDVFDAVDWVFQTDRAGELGYDPNNVILGGISAGGTMALAAAVREIETVSGLSSQYALVRDWDARVSGFSLTRIWRHQCIHHSCSDLRGTRSLPFMVHRARTD